MTIVQPLLDLQDVDGRIRELEMELKDLPRRKALEVARLSGVGADLTAAKAQRQYVEGKIRGQEEEANQLRQKIQDLKTAQAGLKSNREYQQYSMQIENVERELAAAENRWAAAAEDQPSTDSLITDAQSKYDTEKVGVDQFCREIDERIANLEAELKAAQAERAEKAKLVSDPRLKLYYERLRTKRWPVVVPLTGDDVCDGCHLVQPPHVAQMVDRQAQLDPARQQMVACTMCGRILYRA